MNMIGFDYSTSANNLSTESNMVERQLNIIERDTLVGNIFGDASIRYRGNNKSYIIYGYANEEYSNFVLNNLKNLINKKSSTKFENNDKRYENKIRYSYTFSTKSLNSIFNISKLFLQPNINMNLEDMSTKMIKEKKIKFKKILPPYDLMYDLLTPRALAFWIMDDGQAVKKGGVTLCTDNFSEEEVLKLKTILENKFKFVCTIHNKKGKNNSYHRIYISKTSLPLLISLVQEFMHPSMLYKINLDVPLKSKETLSQSKKAIKAREEKLRITEWQKEHGKGSYPPKIVFERIFSTNPRAVAARLKRAQIGNPRHFSTSSVRDDWWKKTKDLLKEATKGIKNITKKTRNSNSGDIQFDPNRMVRNPNPNPNPNPNLNPNPNPNLNPNLSDSLSVKESVRENSDGMISQERQDSVRENSDGRSFQERQDSENSDDKSSPSIETLNYEEETGLEIARFEVNLISSAETSLKKYAPYLILKIKNLTLKKFINYYEENSGNLTDPSKSFGVDQDGLKELYDFAKKLQNIHDNIPSHLKADKYWEFLSDYQAGDSDSEYSLEKEAGPSGSQNQSQPLNYENPTSEEEETPTVTESPTSEELRRVRLNSNPFSKYLNPYWKGLWSEANKKYTDKDKDNKNDPKDDNSSKGDDNSSKGDDGGDFFDGDGGGGE